MSRNLDMPNEEHLSILKQGADVWNGWRKDNPDVGIDINGIRLNKVDLCGANFDNVSLINSIFNGVDLREANFNHTDLWGTEFIKSNLEAATFQGAIFRMADLTEAILSKANFNGAVIRASRFNSSILTEVDFQWVKCSGCIFAEANLTGATLIEASLRGVNLNAANIKNTILGDTIFSNIDLSEVIGLENVVHQEPSIIGTDTIAKSKGKIPDVFLRGCGLSDVDIEYAKLANPDLSNEEINKTLYRIYDLRATQAFQISPLFISYSHGDSTFVDKLEINLNEKGIRFWRDTHDATAGRLEKQIDRAMRLNPTVLLILSEHSIKSDWVEHEVRTARELEKEIRRDVLCPVALDDSWKSSPWPKRVTEQVMEYNILDFSAWKDDSKFEGMFRKLIGGLELFYKK